MAPSYALPLLAVMFIDVVLDELRPASSSLGDGSLTRRSRPREAAPLVVGVGPYGTSLPLHCCIQRFDRVLFTRSGPGPLLSIHEHIDWYLEMLAWPHSITGLGVAVLASLYSRPLSETAELRASLASRRLDPPDRVSSLLHRRQRERFRSARRCNDGDCVRSHPRATSRFLGRTTLDRH